MTLAAPPVLAAGLLVTAGLAWAMTAVARRRAAALRAAGIAAGGGTRLAGAWLTIGGLAVLAFAAAGPAASVRAPQASGTVILAMDVSGSMGATDVPPTRLAAAQRVATQFIAAQPAGVKIGVVAFEEGALTTASPTSDHSVASAAVRRLRIAGGTSLGSAIVVALSAITGRAVTVGSQGVLPDIGYWPSAVIVIFSDGQDEGEGVSTSTAAQVAQKAGVHIDTVGVGTTAGTTVDADGYHLHTALDAATLRSISQVTGGVYHPASDASELGSIASSIDLRLTLASRQLPLAGPFIALALALLAAGAAVTIAASGRVV